MKSVAIQCIIILSRYRKEVKIITDSSRADYFKQRRQNKKTFSVLRDREKVEKIEEHLKKQNKTKTIWLEEKINEELEKEE